MTKLTEYMSLEMKTLNQSRIRSVFLARSHIKTNSDSKSEDITTLKTPIYLFAKQFPKPTSYPHVLFQYITGPSSSDSALFYL